MAFIRARNVRQTVHLESQTIVLCAPQMWHCIHIRTFHTILLDVLSERHRQRKLVKSNEKKKQSTQRKWGRKKVCSTLNVHILLDS